MKKELNEIVKDSFNKEILIELYNQENHQVIDLILEKLSNKNKRSFFSFLGKKKECLEGQLALKILLALMMKTLEDHKEYKLDFNYNYGIDLAELTRMVLILELIEDKEKENILAFKLKKLINEAAKYIQKNYNHYPKNLIKSKVWKSGAEIRKCATLMACYYERNKNINGKLEMLYARGRVTNSILNHYFYIVAPDMIAIAKCFEQIGYTDSALKFYKPLLEDFEWVVRDIITLIADKKKPTPEDIISLEALKEAYEGAQRTDNDIQKDHFSKNIKEINHILEIYGSKN